MIYVCVCVCLLSGAPFKSLLSNKKKQSKNQGLFEQKIDFFGAVMRHGGGNIIVWESLHFWFSYKFCMEAKCSWWVCEFIYLSVKVQEEGSISVG